MASSPANFSRFGEQVAIVTGGADGLGKGITARLLSEGCKVMILDINEANGNKAVEEFNATYPDKVAFTKTDISDPDSVDAAVANTVATFGGLDISINCAGIVGPTGKKILDVTADQFDLVYRINLKGSFNITKSSIREMEKKNYGRVLLIASIAGKEGNAGMTAYSTSKAGVIGLVKAVGKEYAETGITVNGLCPAVVKTAMVEAMPPTQVKYMTDKIPMKRCGTIEEVAATAAFIVSKEASFNTATCFDLTGGRATY